MQYNKGNTNNWSYKPLIKQTQYRQALVLLNVMILTLIFVAKLTYANAITIQSKENGDENNIEFASLDGAAQVFPTGGIAAPITLSPTIATEKETTAPQTLSTAYKEYPLSPLTSSIVYTELHGGEILKEMILSSAKNPYIVREDIEIAKGARLIIEPGVTIEFAPTVGITVKGVLHAVGTPTAHITLTSTSQGQLTQSKTQLDLAVERGIRLVDGPNGPLEGRLQFFHKGSWRAVCTNSRNWTAVDFNVACRQLGFKGGRFWNWVERIPGYAPRLLYEQPLCKGGEKSLFDCAWHSRQLGSGVCDYHNDIGIQCVPMHNTNNSHWRGITFEDSPITKSLDRDNTVYSSMSQSFLRYVDIIRAGSGKNNIVTSAVEAVGLPPQMEHVIITSSAYTGVNVTKPNSGFVMQNVTVRMCNGIGIFVNSSQGNVQLNGCKVIENAADGVKYIAHDLRAEERTDRASIFDFCTLPTTSGQTYPISLSFNQKFYSGSVKECAKYFFTRPGYLLTVHFEHFVLQKNETASIEIFDGSSANDRLLFTWKARNYTRPQAVTSTREKLFIRIKADMREEINAFIRLTSAKTSAFDLLIKDSTIENNGGRGIAIDNIRSKIHVDRSSVAGNGHIAGVHIKSGAGDVNITNSNISFNSGDGINITYYGGNRNISRSIISSNRGYGIAVWLNDTSDINRIEYIPFNQTTVIEYSKIYGNVEHGILHGNFCEPLWINVTSNHFNGSLDNDIMIVSCWTYTKTNTANLQLQIGHNFFENSQRNSICISPALNMQAKIEYNQFRGGTYGAIYIRNDFIYEVFNFLPVRILVQSNYFMRNKGMYVASLGLSPFSRREFQSLLFTRNFLKENRILESFGPLIQGSEGNEGSGRLSPRNRVAAPIVIGSSTVDIYRNILHNLDSTYEIGSQLNDQSQIINATYNWLGYTDENKIYTRLFHRNDRYNLARIEYIPYLLHSSNPASTTIIAISTLVPQFFHEGAETIGGEVDGQEIIPPGTYTVNKDINIRPGGKLILQPGVTLKFEPSVGMMVAGILEARGRRPDDIFFTLKRQTVITMNNGTEMDDVEELNLETLDIETESIIETSDSPVPVRLIGGAGDYEGRLQLYLDGRWGTVCDYGWTVINAALVCHHLGYTLNPQDWRLLRSQMPNVGVTDDIIVSNVRCTEHDRDIRKCRAERLQYGEFENSCTHENDVGIRCYEGGWAGLRFSVLAERANLQYLTIEKAGLFDYTTNSFKPAIQMDFARHNLENVRVIDNLNDGLGIIYSDIFGGKSINNIRNSEFIGNRGSGISFKQLDFRIQNSIIKSNRGSGVSHDPVIYALDQKEIGGWFNLPRDFNTFESNYEPYLLPQDNGNIDIGAWESKYIRTQEVLGTDIRRKLFVRCPAGYVLGIQLLNPIQAHSTERISITDALTENTRSDIWLLHRDLNVFPTTSSSYGIIIDYESGVNAIGGVVLMVSTIIAPVQNIRNKVVRGPVPTLNVVSTKIKNNLRGISAYYYNRYIGDEGEHYLRKANESIKIVNSELSNNEREAILIKSPYWDVQNSNLSEVTVHLNSSMVTQNGYGIRQISKDLRSSNNLFHYVVQDTTVEDNARGGLHLYLPYVWKYNENFTHSVFLGNNTWQRNRNFYIAVTGHYAVFNMSNNVFLDNSCRRSLLLLDGMEKRVKFDNNRIENNNAKFIMEFKADSLCEIIGEVPAVLEYNIIKGNHYNLISKNLPLRTRGHQIRTQSNLATAVIRLDGIQNVKLYRNLIAENSMKYNLVAGLVTARVNNYFYATENWWGSTDIKYIEEKIFDFDNWNDHADVIFQPFLIEDSFDASVSIVSKRNNEIDLSTWSGGPVFKDLILRKRSNPYRIHSDITIMPGVTMTIQHGTTLEFESNVGILVLGTLIAIGYKESNIVMKPFSNSTHESIVLLDRRALEDMNESQTVYDSIRLCTSSQNCTSDSYASHEINEGFLEYFNHTTLQWVPICDSRFTLRNAQVVCRELGYDPLNVYYGHDRRHEFHTNSLTRIWTWVQPMECRGDETRMEECSERLNGQLYGHHHECHWDDVFVFVSCSSLPEEQTYWGGIRFANSDFEENHYEYRIHDTHTHGFVQSKVSRLEFLRLENAGILHNQKSPAIQAVYKTPSISSITILNSAHDGINFIAPNGGLNLNHLNINNAFGAGISILSLTGEGRESDESSFTPLRGLDIPYKIFSMIDICDPQKILTVEERVLIYYKYDNNPVNCIKIFTAAFRAKPLGFRLLQSHLFNHTKEYGRTDSIRLFDGDIYNVTSQFIAQIESDSTNQRSFFKTKHSPTLSIQLIASGAPETHGFIAEIVTVPISTIGQFRDALHNVTYSHISNTMKSAITYSSAGEITPTLTLTSNRIQGNCRQLYGNFSTCTSALNLDIQNMHSLYFMNNLLISNQGGLRIRADSRGSATSLRGFIHHNLFLRNANRPALYVEGRQSSPYQEIELYRNYFAQNQAGYEDVIKLRQVVSNFSYNYVHSNVGGRIVEVSGFEKVRLPIYQTTSHNGFYGNIATNWMGRATIVAGTAGQQYVDNIFENPENDYEMITVNNSILNIESYNSTLELWRSRIDARHNYWSYNNTISVQSRIRDRSDDSSLLEVQSVPFQMNNLTILDGKCPPGWTLVMDTCFIYVGAPMAFNEARQFCRSENSSMPFIRTDSTTLWSYLQGQMQHLKYPEKVWVQDFDHIDRCTSFQFRTIDIEDCDNELGFICEIDPKVVIDPLRWRADVFTISIISAFFLFIILMIMVIFCWYAKSRHRQAQRLQRRNSIRQSLRSLNSIDPQGSLRRRNFNMSSSTGTLTKAYGQDYKKMMGNGSIDSMNKSVLSSEAGSFDAYDNNARLENEYQTNEYVRPNGVHLDKFRQAPQRVATIGSISKGSAARDRAVAALAYEHQQHPNSFELSYRNDIFPDTTGMRHNSNSASVAEDTPIIHHTDPEDGGSDYYGNSSTLPLRNGESESLSFLSELKQNLPEFKTQTHTSFLSGEKTERPNSQFSTSSYSSSTPYEQKIDNFHFTPVPEPNDDKVYRKNNTSNISDMRRPDSYYTAVRSSKMQPQLTRISATSHNDPKKARMSGNNSITNNNIVNSTNQNNRPKTVYQSPATTTIGNIGDPMSSYQRSKSEALLETDFDYKSLTVPLGRSYSQPLETAM